LAKDLRIFKALHPPGVAVEDLELGYFAGKKLEKALGPISFSLTPGKTTSLIGPSGSGKSSLLKALIGQLRPNRGNINVNYPSQESQRSSVVFQDDTVFPWLTALGNVAYPLRLAGFSRTESNTQAMLWLERVGLGKSKAKFPAELSGGMLQRVAVARALAFEPNLLVLDEPFGQLDELTRMDVGVMVAKLLSEANATTVLVTHSIDEALLLSDRILVLSPAPGRLVLDVSIEFKYPRGRETLYEPNFLILRKEILNALSSSKSGALDVN
jgi:NitT/TauT family transport system ATP-binding protein